MNNSIEIPTNGRANIENSGMGLTISIPVKKNWFVVLFMTVWLCGWLFGGINAISGLINNIINNTENSNIFTIIWLILWAFASLFVIRLLIWNFIGEEIITIERGILTLEKSGLVLNKTMSYDISQCRNFKIQGNLPIFSTPFSIIQSNNPFSAFSGSGLIKFDYGMKTIRFASGIDDTEANFILQTLKDRKILLDSNF